MEHSLNQHKSMPSFQRRLQDEWKRTVPTAQPFTALLFTRVCRKIVFHCIPNGRNWNLQELA
jgi:hypothetical protein